jgi:hypothetical protein
MKKHALLMTVLLALPVAAWSEPAQDKLADKYSAFAGSPEKAKALVNDLRNGSFTQSSGKMGYGNVDITLALAEARLKDQGVSNPTRDQLKNTINDILKLRADGKGWGQIANSYGFKLGEVMRHEKAERPARVAHQRMDRAERPEKLERPEKPARPERPDTPHRAR